MLFKVQCVVCVLMTPHLFLYFRITFGGLTSAPKVLVYHQQAYASPPAGAARLAPGPAPPPALPPLPFSRCTWKE